MQGMNAFSAAAVRKSPPLEGDGITQTHILNHTVLFTSEDHGRRETLIKKKYGTGLFSEEALSFYSLSLQRTTIPDKVFT